MTSAAASALHHRLGCPEGETMPRFSRRGSGLRLLLGVVLVLCCAASLIITSIVSETRIGLPEGPGASLPPVPLPRNSERLPWFMAKGKVRPEPAPRDPVTGRHIAQLWPEEAPGEDRVLSQLSFVPPGWHDGDRKPLKKIVMYNGWPSWGGLKAGREVFTRERCPVDACTLTDRREDAADADAVVFQDSFYRPTGPRPRQQVWILWSMESPLHTDVFESDVFFNWTATHSLVSDLVSPYSWWQYYDPAVTQRPLAEMPNYAANKTRKVAWFVSNCAAKNGRLQYAEELAKYIEVDTYGDCGRLTCPRDGTNMCFELLDRHYKFYLAFENSNCKDYITEKFFVNGLGHNVIPIAMGARPQDYARAAPEHSYILVDDFVSPRALAEYLHRLDRDDALYNAYFRWQGTGQFVDSHFYCRLCALLHDPDAPPRWYSDVNAWLRRPGTCTPGLWRGPRW